ALAVLMLLAQVIAALRWQPKIFHFYEDGFTLLDEQGQARKGYYYAQVNDYNVRKVVIPWNQMVFGVAGALLGMGVGSTFIQDAASQIGAKVGERLDTQRSERISEMPRKDVNRSILTIQIRGERLITMNKTYVNFGALLARFPSMMHAGLSSSR